MNKPKDIIDSLPDGNRKRACIIADAVLEGDGADVFWANMDKGDHQNAAKCLSRDSLPAFFGVLADMIWEG